jgi:hypothetical protein
MLGDGGSWPTQAFHEFCGAGGATVLITPASRLSDVRRGCKDTSSAGANQLDEGVGWGGAIAWRVNRGQRLPLPGQRTNTKVLWTPRVAGSILRETT